MASQASTSKSKTPLADSDVTKEIKKLHIDMVIHLSKHFTPSLNVPWDELLVHLSLFLEPAELNQDSFFKICDILMNKEIIDYGKYDELYKVIHQINVRPAKIIQETSKRIHDLQAQGPSDDNQPKTGEVNPPRTEEDNQKTEIAPRLRPMIETTKAMISKEKEKYNFFQTKSFQAAKEKLMKNGLVIIKGNSGDGKTSMALELLRLQCCDGVDGQRRQPLELHDIPDFKSVAPKSQLVIYVDDIFGKNVVCERDVDEWEKRVESILSKFCGKEHRDGNFLVITVRNGIFNSLKQEGSLPKVFTKENIVDVNLDEKEKLELLRLYEPKDNFDSWKDEEEKAIIWCAPDLGFPQCCRLFRDTPTLHTERAHFFKSPSDFLKSSLFKLKDGKFSGLMYLFLKGGLIWENDLDAHNANIDQAVLEAAFAVDVVRVTRVGEPLYRMPKERKIEFVKDSLDCLLGWLVKKEPNHKQKVYYKFNHDSIEETVALLYREKTPIGFIQNCPRVYLRYITTSQTTPNQILISSDDQKNAMYNRIVRELKSEYHNGWSGWSYSSVTFIISDDPIEHVSGYDSIMSSGVWTDVQFLQGFITWLKGQDVDQNLCHDIKLALLNKACRSGSEDQALLFIANEMSEGVKPNNDTVYNAVRGGCVNVLKQIYKYISNEIKPRLLNNACSYGSEDCALFLLSQGVKPDEDTLFCKVEGGCLNLLKEDFRDLNHEMKSRLLNKACSSGSEECALFLLSEGVIPDLKTLFSVLQGGCVNLLGKLLEDDIYTTARADESQSSLLTCIIHVLLEAILSKRKEMVFKLFDRYPHLVHDTDELGQSLLHLVIHEGNCGLFQRVERMMLNSLFRVENEQHKCEVVNGRVVHRHCMCAQYICQLVDQRGHTVLHTSCIWGNRDVCKYLCESYPALTTVVSNSGETVLHSTCHHGWKLTIQYRCESFTALTAFVSKSRGPRNECEYHCELFPVLRMVVNNDKKPGSKEFLRTITSTDTGTSFTSGVTYGGGNIDDHDFLCDLFPAQTTVVNYKGETVIHYRCKAGDRDIVKYLCELFPALTAVVSNDGRHCLHYIAESRFSNVDMFIECETHVKQYLESTGGEYDITTIRDNEENSVLDLAKKGARYRREEEFVREHGERGRERGYDYRVFTDKKYEDKNDPLYGHIVQLFGQ